MLQADQEVVLAAVAQNGQARRHASAELQEDRAVLLAWSMDGGPGAHVDTTLITGHDLLSFGASIDA